MNLMLIALIILLIFNVVSGYKKGMVKSIISFVSLIVLCILATLITQGMKSYVKGQVANVIVVLILLSLLGIVHHLLGVVFFSAKMISKLPIVQSLDKVLGIVVGILETVLIIWTIYTFIMILDMGMIGQQVVQYTQESTILLWFYQHNELAKWVQYLGAQFHLL